MYYFTGIKIVKLPILSLGKFAISNCNYKEKNYRKYGVKEY